MLKKIQEKQYSVLIFYTTVFAMSIILSPFPHINAQPFNLATPIGGTANIVIITAANENNDIIKNCLTVNPSDQDECTNTGSSIFFTINPPSNTVTLQCTLNIDFNNNPANQPFACTSTSLQITNLPQNSGALSLQVQAFDDSNELISQNVFQWLQGTGGGGGGFTPVGDIATDLQGDPALGGSTDQLSTSNIFSSPFKACIAYETQLKGPKTADSNSPTIASDLQNIFVKHFPSVATYTIEGKASIDKFKTELDGTKTFTIRIFHDLVPTVQNFALESGATRYTGKLISDELEDKSVRYQVDKIFTSCKFYSVVEPTIPKSVSLPSKPIGDIEQKDDGKIPDNDLAVGGPLVAFDNPPQVLNPLFDSCTQTVVNPEVAVYNIVGKAKLNDVNNINREKLTVQNL